MSLLTIGSGILVLNFLIIVHELGHFLAARRVGLSAPEFSIGFGPRLLGFQLGETEFVWRLIPIGGYVALPALAPEGDLLGDSWSGRFTALLCGPVANLGLALWLLGPVGFLTASSLWFTSLLGIFGGGPESELIGIVGLANVAGQAASHGWPTLRALAGFLSLNLGLFNLLPFPGLDGGRLVSLLMERALGGRRPTWEPAVQGMGMLFLLMVMLWVTGRELVHAIL